MAWQSTKIAKKVGTEKKITEIEVHWTVSFHLRPTGELNFVGVLLWFFFLCIHPILQAHGDPSPLFTSPEEYESRKWNHVHQCASPAVTAHGRRWERKGRMSEAGAWQCEGYSYSLGQIQQWHWRNHREKSIATKSEASEKNAKQTLESQKQTLVCRFGILFRLKNTPNRRRTPRGDQLSLRQQVE